jgi:hypothetical protein
MKKPSKTAGELEASIRVDLEFICDLPTDIAISVQPDGDTWKVVISENPTPLEPSRREMILLIAEALKCEFDLKV